MIPSKPRNFINGFYRALKRANEIGLLLLIKTTFIAFKREGIVGVLLLIKKNATTFAKAVARHSNYDQWMDLHDSIKPADIANMKDIIAGWNAKPLISILMPTYNSSPIFLAAAIDSVINQIYLNWELCIADDASSNLEVVELLKRYQGYGNKIKVAFRQDNGHISAASNTALELATGDWIALLDHDDLLPQSALFWVVDAINKNNDIQIIYSDEDKVDESGKRFDPYFNPDWNKDFFYSQNYFCHLGVYRKSLIEEIGGFRIGYEGAQDYDLVLRCIEKINPQSIYHIPRVLYSWRSHEKSTAQSMTAKNYAVNAGERALNDHFKRVGIKGYVEIVSGGYRAHYDLPDKPPLVSLIIPTRNNHYLVRKCIESILGKTTYPNYEIILVDNNSDELESLKYFSRLASDGVIKLMEYQHPFNYSAINNFAVKQARGEIVGLINNDIEVISPEWLSEMVSIVCQDGVGSVGAKLLYSDNRIQHAGVIVGLGGVAGHSHKYFERDAPGYFFRAKLISSFSAVTAACLLVRKSLYLQVDGLNEKDLIVAFNDVDFCLKLREIGYRNIWTPYAELYHHESASRGSEDSPEKVARFNGELNYMRRRWADTIQQDPAYSPNLTLDYEDFTYARQPRTMNFNNT